jgi:hypothetical protein
VTDGKTFLFIADKLLLVLLRKRKIVADCIITIEVIKMQIQSEYVSIKIKFYFMFALDLHFFYVYCYNVVSLTTTRRVTSLCCVTLQTSPSIVSKHLACYV